MTIPPELLPVIQITLPIIITILVAVGMQNRRLDDVVGRIAAIEARLISIDSRLASLEQRIVRLEERIPSQFLHIK